MVNPSMIGGRRIASECIRPEVNEFLDQMLRDKDKNLRLEEVAVPLGSTLAGIALKDTPIRRETRVLVVAVRDANRAFTYNPEPDFRAQDGALLIVMGETDSIVKLRQLVATASPGRRSSRRGAPGRAPSARRVGVQRPPPSRRRLTPPAPRSARIAGQLQERALACRRTQRNFRRPAVGRSAMLDDAEEKLRGGGGLDLRERLQRAEARLRVLDSRTTRASGSKAWRRRAPRASWPPGPRPPGSGSPCAAATVAKLRLK